MEIIKKKFETLVKNLIWKHKGDPQQILKASKSTTNFGSIRFQDRLKISLSLLSSNSSFLTLAEEDEEVCMEEFFEEDPTIFEDVQEEEVFDRQMAIREVTKDFEKSDEYFKRVSSK